MGELTGKSIIITGAGNGLGRAYALAVAKAGGNVVVNDISGDAARSVAAEVEALGVRAVVSADPIGSPQVGEALSVLCETSFGRVDGIINNAGVHHLRLAWEESPEEVERIIRVNLLGLIHCGVAAMKRMRAQGSGAIINIGSGSMRGNRPEMGAYGCSKAAVMTLTTVWATELEGSGVHVHGISPTARTQMNLDSAPQYHFNTGPEVMAPLAVFLLGERAAPLNGKMIRLDEGRVSIFEIGTYGPVLGERLDWTSDALAEALLPAIR